MSTCVVLYEVVFTVGFRQTGARCAGVWLKVTRLFSQVGVRRADKQYSAIKMVSMGCCHLAVSFVCKTYYILAYPSICTAK